MDAGTINLVGKQSKSPQQRLGAAARTMGGVAGAIMVQANARHAELTKQAQRLVGQTFFGTMLRQMRNSPFKTELSSGGRAGEAYASLYDQHLAEHMASGAGRSLADSIVRHIEKNQPLTGK